jgi:uncharacterized protein (DUF4415 family)
MKRVEGFGDLSPDHNARLAARPEPEIDTSDIPEWTDADFAAAIRLQGRPFAEVLRLYRARKAVITARIDLDVLDWLKSKGGGYQTRLNAILRDAMAKDLTAGPKKAAPVSGKPKSTAAKASAAKHATAGHPKNSRAPAAKKATAGTAHKPKASTPVLGKGKRSPTAKTAKQRRPSPGRQEVGSA